MRLKVRVLGIEPYFKAILYTEGLGREHWQPSPGPKVSPKRTIDKLGSLGEVRVEY